MQIGKVVSALNCYARVRFLPAGFGTWLLLANQKQKSKQRLAALRHMCTTSSYTKRLYTHPLSDLCINSYNGRGKRASRKTRVNVRACHRKHINVIAEILGTTCTPFPSQITVFVFLGFIKSCYLLSALISVLQMTALLQFTFALRPLYSTEY